MAERQRLAREIHDTLAQGFTSIVMLVQAAEAGLDDAQPPARRHLALIAGPPGRTSPRPGRWSPRSRPRRWTARARRRAAPAADRAAGETGIAARVRA